PGGRSTCRARGRDQSRPYDGLLFIRVPELRWRSWRLMPASTCVDCSHCFKIRRYSFGGRPEQETIKQVVEIVDLQAEPAIEIMAFHGLAGQCGHMTSFVGWQCERLVECLRCLCDIGRRGGK